MININFPISTTSSDDVWLTEEHIISLYNIGSVAEYKYIDTRVAMWIESEAIRNGWRSVRWNIIRVPNCGCWLSMNEIELSTVKTPITSTGNLKFDDLLSRAFTKAAQHSCRQGEISSRSWPSLSDLPEPESWKFVGRKYAKEFAIELMATNLSQGNFVEELARTAGRERD